MRFASILLLALLLSVPAWSDENLPVLVPKGERIEGSIRNRIPIKDLHRAILGASEDGTGLAVDLGDETLDGFVYAGPYPFEEGESDYDYERFRLRSAIKGGKGTIPVTPLLRDKLNPHLLLLRIARCCSLSEVVPPSAPWVVRRHHERLPTG